MGPDAPTLVSLALKQRGPKKCCVASVATIPLIGQRALSPSLNLSGDVGKSVRKPQADSSFWKSHGTSRKKSEDTNHQVIISICLKLPTVSGFFHTVVSAQQLRRWKSSCWLTLFQIARGKPTQSVWLRTSFHHRNRLLEFRTWTKRLAKLLCMCMCTFCCGNVIDLTVPKKRLARHDLSKARLVLLLYWPHTSCSYSCLKAESYMQVAHSLGRVLQLPRKCGFKDHTSTDPKAVHRIQRQSRFQEASLAISNTADCVAAKAFSNQSHTCKQHGDRGE